MATTGPDDDDLRSMLDSLEEPADVVNFQTLDNREIIRRYTSVQLELKRRHEIERPTTDEGRRLHSEHGALFIELGRRHLR